MAEIPSRILDLCERAAARLRQVEGIDAIALGGSWSRGTARPDSDIDLGLGYDSARPFSLDALSEAARDLDDRHLPGLVNHPGEWGAGVNGGGWLLIDGNHVDLLYRDLRRMREVIERCVAGEPDAVYQLGHPMGFQNQIYAGETFYCRPLYDRTGELARLKAMVAEYPAKLRIALVRKHLFDAGFHIEIAGKPADRADCPYVALCLASAAGFMTMVIYALNRRYFMNEKGAFIESAAFQICPAQFHSAVARIIGAIGSDAAALAMSVEAMRAVHRDLALLCRAELPEADLENSLGALWRE